MREYEASARTVEEAIEQGLEELGVSIGDVDVYVVEEGSKGLFGLFGSRQAKVRLTVKESEADPLGDLMQAEQKPAKAKPAKKPEKAAKEEKPAKAEKPEKTEKAEKKEEQAKPAEKAEKAEKTEKAEKAEKKPKPVKREAKKPAEKKAEAAEEKEGNEENEGNGEEKQPKTVRAEVKPMEKPEVTMIAAEALDPESPAGIAHTFLADLTKLMGVDVTIDMGTDAEGNVYGYINGDTLGVLIGRRGETLDAVQYLTSLKVNRDREGYIRVTLDTEGYRARREDTLIRLANRMANRALRTGRKVSLEPMNPYERRIIHYALQPVEGISTHSEGDDPNRHVVITVDK